MREADQAREVERMVQALSLFGRRQRVTAEPQHLAGRGAPFRRNAVERKTVALTVRGARGKVGSQAAGPLAPIGEVVRRPALHPQHMVVRALGDGSQRQRVCGAGLHHVGQDLCSLVAVFIGRQRHDQDKQREANEEKHPAIAARQSEIGTARREPVAARRRLRHAGCHGYCAAYM